MSARGWIEVIPARCLIQLSPQAQGCYKTAAARGEASGDSQAASLNTAQLVGAAVRLGQSISKWDFAWFEGFLISSLSLSLWNAFVLQSEWDTEDFTSICIILYIYFKDFDRVGGCCIFLDKTYSIYYLGWGY